MTQDSELDEVSSRLKDPISLNSLLSENGTEFTVRENDFLDDEEEEDTNVEAVYPLEKLQSLILTPNGNDDDEEINLTHDFEKLSEEMVNVRDDGKVKKKITRCGAGEHMSDDECVYSIYLHYAGYTEYADYPYDATRLRHKRPVKLRSDELIPGMAIAIRSMRRGEQALFLIHPDLAYKESGVPPRIPPNATLLFNIELSDFCLVTAETDSTPPDQPETYQSNIDKARRCRERGNARKKTEKNVNGAISQYRRGICILLSSHMANENEEEEVRRELVKLYTNLAVSYLAKQDYRRVCTAYNDAIHDCREHAFKNIKLHYISAKALRFLGSYDEAMNRIRKANKLKPGDSDISKEMDELRDAIAKAKKSEKDYTAKMFGFSTPDTEMDSEELDEVDETFSSAFNIFLDDFIRDEGKKVHRMEPCSIAENAYCKRLCRAKGISVKEVGPPNNQRLFLSKRSL